MESVENALIWLIGIGLAIMVGGLIYQRCRRRRTAEDPAG